MAEQVPLSTALARRFMRWAHDNAAGKDWETMKDELPDAVAGWLAEEVPDTSFDAIDFRLIIRKHFACQGGRMSVDFDGIAADLLAAP